MTPLPFDCFVGENPEVVSNRFTGESCTLPPEAVAVYNCIIGAELIGNLEMVSQGIDWFIENFPDEYKKLSKNLNLLFGILKCFS